MDREQIKDQSRIAKALARANELIEKTGGEVMRRFVIEHHAKLASLKGMMPVINKFCKKPTVFFYPWKHTVMRRGWRKNSRKMNKSYP